MGFDQTPAPRARPTRLMALAGALALVSLAFVGVGLMENGTVSSRATEKASAAAMEAAANHWREFVTKHPKSQRAKQSRDESHCAGTHHFPLSFPRPRPSSRCGILRPSTAAHTQSYTHTHTLTHN